jgi:osmotically-inducible protein OsmY
MKAMVAVLVFSLTLSALPDSQHRAANPPPQFTLRVQREVMHRILMLPYYGVFDMIGFKVEGYDVTLTGKVTRPTLKDDAAHVIKGIEGVEHVNNRIEVLPVSFFDDRIRRDEYRAIYGYGPLQRYALPPIKPIRIIVEHGHVSLEGIVDNQFDKNVAGIRANGVAGAFSVTNNLVITAGKSERPKK